MTIWAISVSIESKVVKVHSKQNTEKSDIDFKKKVLVAKQRNVRLEVYKHSSNYSSIWR
jgi:hypothetical protein